ncbi:hypothetical protein ACAF76_009240 [Brevibacillus sp. TJ4]
MKNQNQQETGLSSQDIQIIGLVLSVIGALLQTIGYVQEVQQSSSSRK